MSRNRSPLFDNVYNQLPREFKRMDVKKVLYQMNYSPDNCQHVIERLEIRGQVERIGYGKYTKC